MQKLPKQIAKQHGKTNMPNKNAQNIAKKTWPKQDDQNKLDKQIANQNARRNIAKTQLQTYCRNKMANKKITLTLEESLVKAFEDRYGDTKSWLLGEFTWRASQVKKEIIEET